MRRNYCEKNMLLGRLMLIWYSQTIFLSKVFILIQWPFQNTYNRNRDQTKVLDPVTSKILPSIGYGSDSNCIQLIAHQNSPYVKTNNHSSSTQRGIKWKLKCFLPKICTRSEIFYYPTSSRRAQHWCSHVTSLLILYLFITLAAPGTHVKPIPCSVYTSAAANALISKATTITEISFGATIIRERFTGAAKTEKRRATERWVTAETGHYYHFHFPKRIVHIYPTSYII